MGAVKPSNLLIGETPRLLDEWQDAPVLWGAVRTPSKAVLNVASVTRQWQLL